MIRKEGDRHNQKRSKNSAPSTYVGNNRHMLQEIRDSLIHLRKFESDSCRQEQIMQIKTDLPSSTSASSSNHGPKSSLYRQKALAEIRNSLLPFANVDGLSSAASTVSTVSSTTTSGISSASGLSNTSGSSSPCQSVEHNGNHSQYDDDSVAIRGLKHNRLQCETSNLDVGYKIQCDPQQNGLPKHLPTGLASKVIRKTSFEGGVREMTRVSPALDGSSTASTCSDSLSLRSQHAISSGSDSAKSHLQISRQYSSSFGMEPPPPPPPRLQGPPPTPPRGTTAPSPPPPVQTEFRMVQPPFLQSNQQMQHMLKRISPGPQKNRTASGLNYASGQSQSPTPQRGTSPVSIGRSPIVVQNSLQVQLNYQLQSALFSGQMEPPPPYPIGSANKLASPPPYVSNRQSPTQTANADYHLQKRTSPTIFSPRSLVNAVPANTPTVVTATATSVPLKPAALQAWNARQPPPIMLSVKSTQVQKPILQTAIAPAAPSNAPLPPNYVAAVQQHKGGDSSPTGNANNFTTVPTTDPPSYASTMQAMAAQRGVPSNINSNYNLQMCSSPVPCVAPISAPYINNLTSTLDAQLRTSSPSSSSTAESVSSTLSTQVSSSGAKSNDAQFATTNQSTKKFSPTDTLPSFNHSPECFSSSTVDNTSSKELQNGRGTESFPPKTSLQSPIPQRKLKKNHHQQDDDDDDDDDDEDEDEEEEEDDGGETKVRNYSPQAFKFYMEQHVENVLKSHQQRLHRKHQLETEMAKVGLSEEAQCEMRKMLHKKESNYIRLKRAKMDKAMFVKIKSIGVGAFGEVALVRKLDTAHLYAMKTLRKADVLKRNQVAHVKAERDILAEADNEWVVKLYYSFQDQDNLYFVMDYIPGGDLMSLLIKLGIFQEPLARFYIAELVCAVESVHKMGFIHRDIKPDNILIDRDGHIKLTDFGLCTGFRWTHNSKYYQNGDHNRQDSMEPDEKWTNECQCKANSNLKPLERRWRREHQRCLAHSLVGTPNYIAPEVLMRTGYTQLCDWWSVGVILYEMLVGQPPFLASTPGETQSKVINWEKTLKIPRLANLSPEAKDLILKLCSGHERRLGKNGPNEVKTHSFFSSVDFKEGLRRQPAPFTPTIRGPTDTSNFDPVDPDRLRNSESGDSEDNGNLGFDNGKHPEHAFFEFTFRRFFDDGGHAYPTRTGVGGGGGSGGGGSGSNGSGGGGDGDSQGPVYV